MADPWQQAMNLPIEVAALAERLVAEEILTGVVGAWPVWTAYSLANNRIIEGPATSFPLDPPTRPSTAGALLGQAFRNNAADRREIRQHTTPGMVSVGNAVDYARDVGWIDNNGVLIYEEATKAGLASGVRRVHAEWGQLPSARVATPF